MTLKMQPDAHWARKLEWTVPRRRDELEQREFDGEAVLYDRRTRCTHRLNATALLVWQQCDGRVTNLELARFLTQRYDVSSDRAVADVEQLLAALGQADLLTAVDT